MSSLAYRPLACLSSHMSLWVQIMVASHTVVIKKYFFIKTIYYSYSIQSLFQRYGVLFMQKATSICMVYSHYENLIPRVVRIDISYIYNNIVLCHQKASQQYWIQPFCSYTWCDKYLLRDHKSFIQDTVFFTIYIYMARPTCHTRITPSVYPE
jgi:hypothetical protein